MSRPVWRGRVRATAGATLLLALVGASFGLRAPLPALAQDRAPVRYGIVAEGTEVRYRVREQLVGLSFPNDAVGATGAVEGSGNGRRRASVGTKVTVGKRSVSSVFRRT